MDDPRLEAARALPASPGIYVMKDAEGREIYVGKAKNLRRRVMSYFLSRDRPAKERAMVESVAAFDHAVCDSELEAFLLENRLIKDLQPKYNVMLRTMEMYPLLEVTWGEDFPRVLVVYRKENPASRYFGPFVGAGNLRAALALLQRTFRFRTCRRRLGEGARPRARGCLKAEVGRCAGPCCGRIGREEYRRRIASLCRFLSGQKAELLDDLRRERDEAAAALRFEQAAALRDLLASLETLHEQPEMDAGLAPFAPQVDGGEALAALAAALGLATPPRRIEGVDIANLQGEETVGALVCFLDGRPFKNGYRRFRIQTVTGQDDFACIAEVVRRRFIRLQEEGGEGPDLLLIDGGLGQLGAAAEALDALGASGPTLVSLAKEEETLFQRGRKTPVPLTPRSPGLRLLMHVRDEAHRFAQQYHHILRRQTLFEKPPRRGSAGRRSGRKTPD